MTVFHRSRRFLPRPDRRFWDRVIRSAADLALGRPVFRFFKRFLPKTLFGRTLVIIVTPVLLTQAIATYYFYERHWDTMTRRLAVAVASETAMFVEDFADAPSDQDRRRLADKVRRNLSILVTHRPGETLRPSEPARGYLFLTDVLEAELEITLDRPFTLNPDFAHNWIEIAVLMDDGILEVLVPRQRLFSSTSQVFIVWMVGSGMILFSVAVLFMRNQIRPIRRLARAAENFGKGREVQTFRLEGATEVRQAARAFLVMRERLQRQISQRTEMLAGVSHDLRTPLTRMKLQLAMLGDGPEIEDLKADVMEMEAMVDGYLAFARGEGTEDLAPIDIGALVDSVAADGRRVGAERGVSITVDIADDDLEIPARENALRRCFGNLIANAVRFGNNVRVAVRRRDFETGDDDPEFEGLSGSYVYVTIDDDGPGIPDSQLETVFKPFLRLDASRNAATGGSGLGLSIARDIARSHGGDVKLANLAGSQPPEDGHAHAAGGLRATVRLPV
ncbi:ATP-binding protein [Fodinicurvata sp. EGI_FJ10296]|uniref:ATP-binding protein n=1 Tax=Fodinicurvata sp. EGI_FJ10296 TaxID=3231908 RepID=UPI003452DC60